MLTAKATSIKVGCALVVLVSAWSVCTAAPKPAKPQPTAKPAAYTESVPSTLVKFDMLGVPGGEIKLADPVKKGSMRAVKIKPFWIGKTEVTWDEFDVYARRLDEPEAKPESKDALSRPSRPYGMVDRGFGHKGYPVINVSHYAAEQYCKWLSTKTGKIYRLPTEAEWEHACRAGAPAPDEKQLGEFAWFWQEKTQPVGKKSPNKWGVCDMLGNVAEWCTDVSGKPVVCGGAYDDMAGDVTPTARKYPTPDWQANDPQNPKSVWWLSDGPFVGFRVIRVTE